MWLIYNIDTGEQIGEWVTEEPQPESGQAYAAVPPSAEAGISHWVPAQRGFADPVVLERHELRGLFTEAEWISAEAVPLNPTYDITSRATVAALLRALSMVDTLKLNETYFVNGISLFVQLGVLTQARAAQALAGIPA